eukprot:TRINITY_DN3119_c0_g1_i4.p1 TRINITY_DN3119_c0_g1~~TRINITY_DN3119_c0_g1_i4.p1  ORF type:complete len:751 (+),score=132.63 TRINITY_DN3119_c0_g1_i4:134-2386(+)
MCIRDSLSTLLIAASAVTPEERAEALVANMTLSEQIALLHGTGWGKDAYVGKVDWAVNNTHMRIPPINLNDGPQGFRCNGLGKCTPGTSTQFPSGLTIAASWDVNAAAAWGSAMGQEFYAKGANVQLGPGMCIARVPRNGRNFEYMSGEDPFLARVLVPKAITGIQREGVVANAKHFVLNNQESNRQTIDVYVDERTLHEIYLPPFESAVAAGVGSFMCSYNKIAGRHACEQNSTLNVALRDQLGFKGWVMSDWHAAHSASIADGLDQEMPGSIYFNQANLQPQPSAVRQSALRILAPLFAAGVFDANNTNDINTNASTPARMAVARELAENSTVLLQNTHSLLPLQIRTTSQPTASVNRIVLMGTDAVKPTTGGEGSGLVNPSYLAVPLNAMLAHVDQTGGTPPSNCSQGQFEESVDYYQPSVIPGPNSAGTSAADCCAQCTAMGTKCRFFSFKKSTKRCWFKTSTTGRRHDPDVVSGGCRDTTVGTEVLFFSDPSQAGEALDGDGTVAIVMISQTSSEGLDRAGLAYSDSDNSMVNDVASQCKHTVVVAVAPGAVLLPWAGNVSSILLPFMPGQMFGDALARLVFGLVSPSGRLPLTLPNKENEMGWSEQQWPGVDGKVIYSEGLQVGYRWYNAHNVTPAFCFGHGLTYSTFSYSALHLGQANGEYTVTFNLTNTGGVVASEVAQLYLSFPQAAGEPPRMLKGFSKVQLAPGSSASVSFGLTARELSIWDVSVHALSLIHISEPTRPY